MTKFVAIGALIEKNLGMSKFKEISEFEGVEYAFVETGRSNDLFQEKQFGQFGEASIMTIIVQNKFKDDVMQLLAKHLNVLDSQSGLIFEEKNIDALKSFS
tara:strand:+ start:176 stop:478 length:303 start_codon:yes stop_codon:yes gene_type:complete